MGVEGARPLENFLYHNDKVLQLGAHPQQVSDLVIRTQM